MGLTSLESVDDFIAVNKANYKAYRHALANVPGVKVFEYDSSEKNNFQYVVLEVDQAEASLSRDTLVKVLWAENVMARRYFYPGCHQMEPYRTLFPEAGQHLPETERLSQKTLILPTGTAVGVAEIEAVAEIIKLAVADAADISRLKA